MELFHHFVQFQLDYVCPTQKFVLVTKKTKYINGAFGEETKPKTSILIHIEQDNKWLIG